MREDAAMGRFGAFIEMMKTGAYWVGIAQGILLGWLLGVVILA